VRYVAQRLLLLIPTLFGIMVLVFLMLHLAPGDPVEMLVEGTSALAPKQLLDLIRSDLGLDRPLHEQFLRYVGRVLRGDLGMSYRTKMPITLDIERNVGSTLVLATAGIVVALLVGVPAGMISALRRNTATDYATLTAAMVGLAAPSFWIGILFLYVFGYRLGWFPIIGGGRGGLLSIVHHLVLPAVVIGLGLAALIARLTRSSTLEVLGQDYVRTARAKGLAGTFIVLKHVLRNAAIPVVAAAGTMFAYLLTGAVVVEIVFSRRGLGQLMVAAINGRDFPLVQGLILVFGAIIVLVNLATDLLLAALDPRVSYQ
jgi:peptide/nickel transport system permease protein/oligopeptide transport system permease protein